MRCLNSMPLNQGNPAPSSSWSGNQTQPIRSSSHSLKPMLLTQLSLRLMEIGKKKTRKMLINVAEEGSGSAWGIPGGHGVVLLEDKREAG